MNISKIYTLTLLALIIVIGLGSICSAEEPGTAFSYQGRLLDDNVAADGLFDFQFILYDDPNFLYGYQVGETIDINDLDVIEGYFTAVLDFGDDGGIFNGEGRWLQIGVRGGQSEDTDEYTIMEPRQQIMPTPYAYHSLSGSDTTGYDPPTKLIGQGGDWGGVDGGDIYYTGGNVGIGMASPATDLHVFGSGELARFEAETGARMTFQNNAGSPATISAVFQHLPGLTPNDGFAIRTRSNVNVFTTRMVIDLLNGNVGIGTSTPTAKLEVVGTTKTQILEITGGADLAEPFDIGGAESVRPGMVVCIDADNPGQLILSGKAYDRTVAGIVSGANGVNAGLTMRQEGTVADGSLPVALTGRVYCWCDADSGAINPGDLLTTSNTPGHAMKVTDQSKSAGAIIGKAMSKLENGKGLVLVLVSLQ